MYRATRLASSTATKAVPPTFPLIDSPCLSLPSSSPPIIAARRAGSVLFYTYIPEILTRNKVSVTFFFSSNSHSKYSNYRSRVLLIFCFPQDNHLAAINVCGIGERKIIPDRKTLKSTNIHEYCNTHFYFLILKNIDVIFFLINSKTLLIDLCKSKVQWLSKYCQITVK